jgi:hypothetical protein
VFKEKETKPLFFHALKGASVEYPNRAGSPKHQQVLPAEPELATVGVTSGTAKNDKGEEVEQSVLNLQVGDDWALVHYVMWLSCIPLPRAGE